MSAFDKKIAEAGKHFIKNIPTKETGNINIKFSQKHNQQMQKIFEKLKIHSV